MGHAEERGQTVGDGNDGRGIPHNDLFDTSSWPMTLVSLLRLVEWGYAALKRVAGLKRFGRLRLVTARRLDRGQDAKLAIFFAAVPETRAANSEPGESREPAVYPSLGARLIPSAMLASSTRFTEIVAGGDLLVPQAASLGPWRLAFGKPKQGIIARQSGNRVLVDFGSSPLKIAAGISVGTWSTHNWFHWLIDILPSIFLSRDLPPEYDKFPILLPSGASDNPSWQEPLAAVIGDREIIFLPSTRSIFVKSLVVIDSPTCPGPLPLSNPGVRPAYAIHSPAMKAYQQHLLGVADTSGAAGRANRAVFIARRGGSRPYDEKRFSEILGRFGFETVYLEDLTLKQAIEVMQGASAVIGPHGAGWANALFCRAGTPALMWTWAEAEPHNWFANVAAVADLDFRAHVGGSFKTHGFHPTPDELEKLVVDWLSNMKTRIS